MSTFDRRQFLRSLTAVSLIPLFSEGGDGQPLTVQSRDRLPDDSPFAVDVPADERDPLLVTIDGDQAYIRVGGFESVDRDTFVEHVLRLDPEVFDSMQLTELPVSSVTPFGHHHTEIGLFARRFGFPHSNGVHEHMSADAINEHWYQFLDDDERWTWPDGTAVSHPEEIFAETFDGRSREPTTSIFADGARKRLARNGTEIFELGINRFWIDSVAFGLKPGLDYSDWAQEAFRDYLSTLEDATLKELGISQPEAVDVREHLKEKDLAPHTGNTPHHDAVFREYRLFQLERERDFVRRLFERIRDSRSEQLQRQGTTTFGLGFELQGHQLTPSAITVVDDLDIVSIETQPTVPPDRPHDITTKIGRAAGRFEKPVRVWGKMTTLFGYTFDLDPTEMHPTLLKIQMAMVYAHGGVRGIELPSLADHQNPGPDSLITWMDDDGSIPETLHGFADFIRAHRSLLTERGSANDAVIAVSLPTLIWQRLPDWGVGRPPHTKAVSGAADLLRREQVPYDVRILDHPRVWKAPEQTAELAEYDLVVLPEVESVTEFQAATIRRALEEGSTVIATGGGPTRDEQYRPRDDVTTAIDTSDNGVLLDSNPSSDPSDTGSGALRDALSATSRQVALSVDTDLSVNLFECSEPERTVIHLVNFTYDRSSDATESVTEFELRVRDLPFVPESATYHRQGGIQSIPVEGDDSEAIVEIPALDVWGFLVISSTDVTMPTAQTESDAAEAVETAKSRVSDARAAGRTELLGRAEEKIETLDPLLDYQAYDEVLEQAESISEWLEQTYRPPTIGLSQVHSGPELDFDRLRTVVDDFEYQTVTDWETETLREIDVLIVAAGDEHDTVSFEFSSTQIAQLEAFVANGNSLLLLGRSRGDPAFNELSAAFGIEFGEETVQTGTDDTRYLVRSVQSAFTDQIPKWYADSSVTLAEGGSATVLARVAPEQDTWLVDEDTGDRTTEDAGGLPVMAATERGAGTVLAMSHPNQLTSPREPSPGLSSFTQTVFRELGRRAFDGQQTTEENGGPDPTESDGEDETDPTDEQDTDPPDDGDEVRETDAFTPGFEIMSALTAVGGAGYLLRRRSTGSTESSE